MRLSLDPPYQLDEAHDIWRRPDFTGIAYSDGTDVEGRLLEQLQSASDLSVLSVELKKLCVDWVSTYHLSGNRANILRPLGSLDGLDVLEIGSGCGAITRYLGESGARVLALEGSERRARITRARTRDLGHVTVLAESFERFATPHRFDVVTLIGVLEYAAQFVSGPSPAMHMLRKAAELLKPGGRLVIAIENRFGLKYFAGADEDHVGQRMFGIEDRYRPNGVRTYGRAELSGLLRRAGFDQVRTMAAFPDYKLPVSIVTEEGLAHPAFDAGALASQTSKQDPQLPYLLNFAPDRVWPGLVANGMALDMANSFLIVARQGPDGTQGAELAWHFSASRQPGFCKQTVFRSSAQGTVTVSYDRLAAGSSSVHHIDGITNDIGHDATFEAGATLEHALRSVFFADGWSVDDLRQPLGDYLSFLGQMAGIQGRPRLDQRVPGHLIDCIPQNLIRDPSGTLHAIDAEWKLDQDLPVGFLMFRSILAIVYSLHRIGTDRDDTVRTPTDLLRTCFAAVEHPLTDDELRAHVVLESSLQSIIIGIEQDPEKTLRYLTVHQIARQDLATYLYAKVARLEQDAASHLATAEHNLGLVWERDRLLQEMLNSTTWKMGGPFRRIKRLLMRLRA